MATEVDGNGSNHWEITIYKDHPTAHQWTITYEQTADPDPAVIRKLTVVRPAPSQVEIKVVLGSDSIPSRRLEQVDWVQVDESGQGVGAVDIRAYLLGDLKRVDGPNFLLARLATGDVTGPITCIERAKGNINLASQSGNLTGNVVMLPGYHLGVALEGSIERLDFTNGIIGTPTGDPNSPYAPVEIQADYAIERVYAKQIHAHIKGTSSADPPTDSFFTVVGDIHAFGTVAPDGLFKGEIRADLLGIDGNVGSDSLRFERRMEGHIWLQRTDESFLGVELLNAAPGLAGTISFSTLFPGSGPGVWTGDVVIGPEFNPNQIRLNGANAGNGYTLPAINLGGGAVGLAPFRQHRDDCWPPDGMEFLDMGARPGPSKPIIMRHYGPVTWVAGTGIPKPFKVERRRHGGCSPDECWTDETNGFQIRQDPALYPAGTVVLLEPISNLQRGYEYRVSLQTFDNGGSQEYVLRSDLPQFSGTADPQIVPYADMYFTVCDSPAEGDANDNGAIAFDDITSVLTNWQQGCCLLPGDADRDGDRDFADITKVLELWNSGNTYCYTGAQSFASKADGFATMDLDQDAPMSADDAAGVITAALIQMGYESIESFSDALNHMTPEEQTAEMRTLGTLLPGGQE